MSQNAPPHLVMAAVTVHPPTQPRAASAQCAEPAPSASPASARRRRHGGRIWTTRPKARAFTRGSGNWDRGGSPQTSSTCFTSGYDVRRLLTASPVSYYKSHNALLSWLLAVITKVQFCSHFCLFSGFLFTLPAR